MMNRTHRNHKYAALVTGFGPFGEHKTNASWEAVKELQKLHGNSIELADVKLVVEEMPVSYEHVLERIPQLWKEHDPIVVWHVGVSQYAECLMVETQAYSTGYVKRDVYNKQPDETDVSAEVLRTTVDVEELCNVVNERSGTSGCKAQVSYNAGRFLCEYIFYQSLAINPANTLFIHVPDLNKYSSMQTAQGLFDMLCFTIEKLRHQR